MEIELIDKPIARQHLLDMAQEQFSNLVKAVVDVERGIMAIGGCGLLLLSFLLLLVGVTLGGFQLSLQHAGHHAADPGGADPARWPLLLRLWPVYPLALFLLLQLLRFVFKKERTQNQSCVGK